MAPKPRAKGTAPAHTMHMNYEPTGQRRSAMDLTTCVVSSASLVGSAYSARFLIPSALNRDLYGGTFVLVCGIIFLQAIGLIASVGVPGLVLMARRQFRLSQPALWLLVLAFSGLAAEVLALILIPKGSNC